MSTTLEIGRIPAAISRARSHSGDGPIFDVANARAVNRGQSSGTSTATEASSVDRASAVASASSSHGGRASGAPVIAWTSRATP